MQVTGQVTDSNGHWAAVDRDGDGVTLRQTERQRHSVEIHFSLIPSMCAMKDG